MAKYSLREKAISLRKNGESYSSIQKSIKVSKSTLSLWLRDIPLTENRLRELRDFNEVRIEKSRQTKLLKKQSRRKEVFEKVKNDFNKIKKPLFKEGFYLYWGEGTKTAEYTVALTSSDLSIIKCFVAWLELFGVERSDMRVKLHVYKNQNLSTLEDFWSKELNINRKHFYKTYIKKAPSTRKTYTGTFENGTCTVLYHDRDTYEYVLEGIKYLREKYK